MWGWGPCTIKGLRDQGTALTRDRPELGLWDSASRWMSSPFRSADAGKGVLTLGENARMLLKTPLWIVLFASVYYQTPLRGSQGRL